MKSWNICQNEEPDDLNDIEITKEEIIKAIDDLEDNLAAGPDGVPSILLKKVKKALALPLSLMLRKSIDEGKKRICSNLHMRCQSTRAALDRD